MTSISERLDITARLNASCEILGVSRLEDDMERKAIREHHEEEARAGIL